MGRGTNAGVTSRPARLTLDLQQITPLWSVELNAPCYQSPVFDERGRLFIADDQNRIHALDARSGARLWILDTGGPVVGLAVEDGGQLAVAGGSTRRASLVDTTHGTAIWTAQRWQATTATTPPGCAPYGRFMVGDSIGWYYGFDVRSGADYNWSAVPAAYRQAAGQAVFAPDGTGFMGCGEPFADNLIRAFNSRGERLWVASMPRSIPGRNPALSTNNVIYVAGWEDKVDGDPSYLRAFAQSSGTQLWAFQTPGRQYGAPVLGPDGTIFVGTMNHGSHDGALFAVTPQGRQRWRTATGANINATPAVGSDGVVYFATLAGTLHGLRTTDGVPLWSHPLAGAANATSPVITDDGLLYISCITGRLECLAVPGLRGPADSPWPLVGGTPRGNGRMRTSR